VFFFSFEMIFVSIYRLNGGNTILRKLKEVKATRMERLIQFRILGSVIGLECQNEDQYQV